MSFLPGRMQRIGTSWVAVILATCACLSDGRSASAGIGRVPDTPGTLTAKLATDLLPLGAAEYSGGNTIISPLSVAMALNMAAGGASGATEEAFRKAISMGKLPTADFVKLFGKDVTGIVSGDPKVAFRSANGIWLADDAKLVPTYVDTLHNSFRARIESVDFSKSKAVKDINDWFARETRNLIPNMVSQLPRDTRVLLANALYFKGQWSIPFQTKATKPTPFHLSNGQAADVPMMRRSDDGFRYCKSENYQAVKLPFGKGDFEVAIVLPTATRDAAKNAAELVSVAWSDCYAERSGQVSLPKLKLTAGGDIKPMLEAIGLKEVFSASADFSKMAKSRVKFDQVVHRVALSWDEEGAEAAAGTAVVMTKSVSTSVDRFEMNVDRPFVFVLSHVKTGAVILVGLVNDPREGSS